MTGSIPSDAIHFCTFTVAFLFTMHSFEKHYDGGVDAFGRKTFPITRGIAGDICAFIWGIASGCDMLSISWCLVLLFSHVYDARSFNLKRYYTMVLSLLSVRIVLFVMHRLVWEIMYWYQLELDPLDDFSEATRTRYFMLINVTYYMYFVGALTLGLRFVFSERATREVVVRRASTRRRP